MNIIRKIAERLYARGIWDWEDCPDKETFIKEVEYVIFEELENSIDLKAIQKALKETEEISFEELKKKIGL